MPYPDLADDVEQKAKTLYQHGQQHVKDNAQHCRMSAGPGLVASDR